MHVWDGRRDRSPRTVVAARALQLQGLDFRFVAERVTDPTDWCFQEPHHVFVVHRRGDLESMEIEFESGPSGSCLPRVGDVWAIPAEQRYAALVRGLTVGFCEIAVPTSVFGGREVTPRVGYRDMLLHRLVERLAGQSHQGGAAAQLFRQSLAQTMQMHLADLYAAPRARRRPVQANRSLKAGDQQIVIDYLLAELDHRIDLNRLADLVDMTPSAFLPAFTAAFGTTPHQYLIEQRIVRAREMLSASSATITEIASAVGFSTPSHFATTFKQRVGVSPTAYRDST
ncbi:helix-turn-helix domain-containing protein [Mycobacterium sp. NPDC003323]